MRIPRVYVEQPLQPGIELQLEADAAHYLANVLRMQPGRQVTLFNGEGGEFTAEVVSTTKKQVGVRIGASLPDAGVSPLAIELAIAVSRGERFDWVVQKATELGVARIQPLWSERVEVKLTGPRLLKKLDHWRRISIGASEQSGRTRLPELAAPLPLRDYLDQPQGNVRLLLHPAEPGSLDRGSLDRDSLDQVLPDRAPGGRPESLSAALLVGPEGGWDDAEVRIILAAGFRAWQLGPRILRTETAPVAALAILQHRFGDG